MNSLETLAGKISPGSGKNSPQLTSSHLIEANVSSALKASCKSCNHNNNHPYQKPHMPHHGSSGNCENSPKEK